MIQNDNLFQNVLVTWKAEKLERDLGQDNFLILRYLRKKISQSKIKSSLTLEFKVTKNGLTNNSVKELNKEVVYFKKESIKKFIEKVDNSIFVLRKKLKNKCKWESKGFVYKTLYVKYIGKIKVRIRRYKTFSEQINFDFFPVLYIFNIDDDMILKLQKEEFLETWIKSKSIRKASKKYEMNKDRFHKLIKKVDFSYNLKPLTYEPVTLFINVDGFWIRNNIKSYWEINQIANCTNIDRYKNKREIYSVCLFTGTKTLKNSKNKKLLNKFSYWMDELKTSQQKTEELKRIIKTLYPNFKKLVVVGDGAGWIEKLAEKLSATYAIDRFHYMKVFCDSLSKLLGGLRKGRVAFKKYKKLFYQLVDQDLDLIEIVQKIANIDTGEVLDESKIRRYFSYCINKFENFVNSKKLQAISVIEAEQSRMIGSFLRYNRASFGLTTASKIRLIATVITNKLTAKLYFNTRIDAVYKHESELEKQKCNTISSEVSEIATSRGISLRGWMTKKKKSDY